MVAYNWWLFREYSNTMWDVLNGFIILCLCVCGLFSKRSVCEAFLTFQSDINDHLFLSALSAERPSSDIVYLKRNSQHAALQMFWATTAISPSQHQQWPWLMRVLFHNIWIAHHCLLTYYNDSHSRILRTWTIFKIMHFLLYFAHRLGKQLINNYIHRKYSMCISSPVTCEKPS